MPDPQAAAATGAAPENAGAEPARRRVETPARYLPTPAEIAAACAEIQAEWTDLDRERRHVGPDRLIWLPPGAERNAVVIGHETVAQ